MRFKKISFFNFRNIKCESMDTDALDIVFLGLNGQGKTNLLEAVYMLSYGSSFRTANLKEVASHGEKSFSISAEIETDDFSCDKIDFRFENGVKKIFLDGKQIKDRKELISSFPCIVYSHEDINFIKGEPDNRRRFFDQMISLYSPVYLDNLRRYYSVLKQRNAAIRNNEIQLLQFYDQKMALYGLELMEERESILSDFNRLYPELFKKISDSDTQIEIRYRTSWKHKTREGILTELKENVERDIKLQTTSSGIHRDRFVIIDEYGPFVNTGSTGQLRLASLLLRVAEGHFFLQKTGKEPVLLIDDVLLELDHAKRARFLAELGSYSQAFYTFLPDENYFESQDSKRLVYNIEKGMWNENYR
jgi:recF protein